MFTLRTGNPSAASEPTTGSICLHGPHQSARKSSRMVAAELTLELEASPGAATASKVAAKVANCMLSSVIAQSANIEGAKRVEDAARRTACTSVHAGGFSIGVQTGGRLNFKSIGKRKATARGNREPDSTPWSLGGRIIAKRGIRHKIK